MIKAVGFDYGGVIAGYHSVVVDKTIAALLGVDVKDYIDAYNNYNLQLQQGSMVGNVFEMIADDFQRPEVVPKIIAYLETKPLEPNPEVVEVFVKIKNLGIKLGLLTNASLHRRVDLQNYDLNKYFDVVDISAETGFIKPSEEAYLHFFKQFDIEPEEMVYVDDVEANLEIPKQLGWQTIYFEDTHKLKLRLTELNILV
jgi:putative hydrolase of the HAD superfamily